VASGGLRDMIPAIARTGEWAVCGEMAGEPPRSLLGGQQGRSLRLASLSAVRPCLHPTLTCPVVPRCARCAAVACGVDGLFMEVHDDPTTSPVDGPTQWPLRCPDTPASPPPPRRSCLAPTTRDRCMPVSCRAAAVPASAALHPPPCNP
jgi:hypothetical protein